jgi:hypothetical protein
VEEVVTMMNTKSEFYTVKQWNEAVNHGGIKRLLRYRDDDNLIKQLVGISLPNVIVTPSNAGFHEVEARLKQHHTALNPNEKKAERDRIFHIIQEYVVTMDYVNSYTDMKEGVDTKRLELEANGSHYYIKETNVKLILKELISRNADIIERVTERMLHRITI